MLIREDEQAPKSGDDTYSALNPNTTSPDYDTLTRFRDSPSDTYSALNPQTTSSDYDTLTISCFSGCPSSPSDEKSSRERDLTAEFIYSSFPTAASALWTEH
ncbi:hypothetical protein MHYP_G00061850 [Metynnis hypsauchen]